LVTSRQVARTKPLTTAIVAVSVVGLALAEGGYSAESRAIIAILCWSAVIGGLVLGVFPFARQPSTSLTSGAVLAVLGILTAVSVGWASDDGAAIDEALRVSSYLGLFALVVCSTRAGDARAWLLGLTIGIAIVAFLALLARLIPDLPGGDEEIAELLPSARGRLSYPIGYWNAIAALLALGMVLLVWLGGTAWTMPGRAAAVATTPMLGVAMYLTSSRGGFAALLVGLVVLVAVGPRRPQLLVSAVLGAVGSGLAIALASGQTELLDAVGGSEADTQGFELLSATLACMLFAGVLRLIADGPAERVRPSSGGTRVAIAALGLAVVAGIIASDPSERLDEFKTVPNTEGAGRANFVSNHLASGSGSGRWQFWGEALDAFRSEPVHGIGAGGYESYWNEHAPISRVSKNAHSLYLEQLAELGPLALLLLLGFLAIGTVRALRVRQAIPVGAARVGVALVATGAASAAIDWVWAVPVVFGVVVVVLGLLAGPALSPEESSGNARLLPSRPGWGIAVLLVGSASLFLAANSLLAERSLEASQAAARHDDLAEAADDARAAIALQPWASEPRLQLALVQEVAGDLDDADESIEEAINRAEDDWSLRVVSARIATLSGRLDDAHEDLAAARRLNPRTPLFNSLSGPLNR
jgi:hypothetical protein